MKVRSLAVLQFFGVGKTEPKVELTDLGDVNIIYGPNGVGKTITTRALGAIFWRNSEQEARPYILAEVEAGSEYWHINIEGGRYLSTPPNPPVTLPEGHRSRYFLSLHDLLRADDADLAKVIQEEIQGGSLEEAAAVLGFSRLEPNRNARERRDYDAATQAARVIEQAQADLHEKESELQQLRAKLTQAEVARRKLAVYTLLEKVRAECAEWGTCQEHEAQYLRDYPGIKDFQSNDLEYYSRSLSGILEAGERQTTANSEAAKARERQQLLFPDGQRPPTTTELATLTDRIEAWATRERQRGEKAAELRSASDAEREALDDIQREEEAVRLLQEQAAAAPATLDAESLLLLDGHVDALRHARGRLDDLAVQRRRHDESLAAAGERFHEKEQTLQHASDTERAALERWGGSPPQAGDIAEIAQKIHNIKLTADQVSAAYRAVDAARNRLAQARYLFSETLSDEHLAGVNQQITTAGLDRLLEKYGDLHACESLLTFLQRMAPTGDITSQEWLKSAVRILEDWLGTAPSVRVTLPNWWAPAYWSASVILTGVASWGCLRVPGTPLLVLLPIAAFVVFIIAGLALPKLLAPAGGNDLQEHEAKYQQLGAPPSGITHITGWERAAIQVRLTEYRDKLTECTGKAMLNAELEIHRRQQENTRAALDDELQHLRRELHAQIGFDGPESATALARLIHQLVAWQQAHADAIARDADVQELEKHLQQQLTEIGSAIAGWGYPETPASTSAADRVFAEVRAALNALEQKVHDTSTARKELEQATIVLTDSQRAVELDEQQHTELQLRCRLDVDAICARAAGCINDTIDEENAEQWVAILHERRKTLDGLQRQLHEKEQLICNSQRRREHQQNTVNTFTVELADIDAGIDALRTLLSTAFTAYGEAAVDTSGEASRRLQSLRERKVHFDQATQTIEEREQAGRDNATAVLRFRTTLEEITGRLGLDTAADEEAHARNEQRLQLLAKTASAFATACEERVKAMTRHESTRLALSCCDGYDAAIDAWSPVELQQAKAAATSESEAIETLQRTITQTELQVDLARRQHDLEKAIIHREASKAKLIQLRDEVIRQHTGDELIEWLRSETDHNSSEVLRLARVLFSEITAGRYELKVSYLGERPHFEAIDSRDPHAPRTLAMLSSATRIQLLIAVRLAFLEVQEAGSARLPLVLDEVLGNSDDQRAEVVVDSILKAIAAPQRRRQLFYFTGQQDEVAKWQSREQAMGADAPASALRWQYRVIGSERLPLAQAAIIADPLPEMAVPAPTPDMSYAAYGRELGLPPFHPASAASAVHLWYVLSRPAELHHALRRRISTLGQLERLMNDGDELMFSRLGISARDSFLDEVREAITVIRCVCEIWRDYHGNPVTREILDASPIADANYYDRVVAIAHECGGDATRLMDGLLTIPRIRQTRIDDLTGYLREKDCLPLNTDSLTPETFPIEINTRLCATPITPDTTTVDTVLTRIGMTALL